MIKSIGMRNSIDYHVVRNKINLLKDAHKGSFLIVEGPSDTRVFKKFVDDKKCLVLPAHGKPNIHNLIRKEKFGEREEVLFIVDVDCEKINDDIKTADNLFFTDCHDRECEILRSKDFEGYLKWANFSEQCKMEIADLKKTILEECKLIGLLRCYSEKNNLGLPFDSIIDSDEDLEYLLTKDLLIDFEKFVTKLKNHEKTPDNARVILNNIPALILELEKAEISSSDLWTICNGHDLTKFLCLFLRKKYDFTPFKKINSVMFEIHLEIIYSGAEFAKTNLYQQIRKWEETHPPYHVFSIF
jgi:hypothetical protein